jgi:hypothetical protein
MLKKIIKRWQSSIEMPTILNPNAKLPYTYISWLLDPHDQSANRRSPIIRSSNSHQSFNIPLFIRLTHSTQHHIHIDPSQWMSHYQYLLPIQLQTPFQCPSKDSLHNRWTCHLSPIIRQCKQIDPHFITHHFFNIITHILISFQFWLQPSQLIKKLFPIEVLYPNHSTLWCLTRSQIIPHSRCSFYVWHFIWIIIYLRSV